MPKSRHRKNHKKKVEAWKQRSQQRINSANKEDVEAFKKLLKRLEKETTFSDLSGKLEKDEEK